MTTYYGTQGNDRKEGTLSDDFLAGYPSNAGYDDYTGDDWLYGLAGNDTLRGGNQNDALYGGDGNDLLYGGTNPIYSGDDQLYGESGNDLLDAGAGSDYLVGGFGSDTLTGGTGRDQFVFNSSTEGTDTIADFSVADDWIIVSKSGFGNNKKLKTDSFLKSSSFQVGAAAKDKNDRFIYNNVTGALFFDADGRKGGFAQVQIAQLSAGLNMTSQNIYVMA
jgi:serralysin